MNGVSRHHFKLKNHYDLGTISGDREGMNAFWKIGGDVYTPVPLASAIALPNSCCSRYSVTVAPASAMSVTVGVRSFITLSVLLTPLSVAALNRSSEGSAETRV